MPKKNIQNNTKNNLNIVVKLINLQIKHPQSLFQRFLTLDMPLNIFVTKNRRYL